MDLDHVYLTHQRSPGNSIRWLVNMRMMSEPSTSHQVNTTRPTLNLDTTVSTGVLLWLEGSSWDFSSVGNSTLSRGSWDCCRSLVSSGGMGSYWERTTVAGKGRWSVKQSCPQACHPAHPDPRGASRGGQGTSPRGKLVHWMPRNQKTQCDMGCYFWAGHACLEETFGRWAQKVTLDSGRMFRREDAQ